MHFIVKQLMQKPYDLIKHEVLLSHLQSTVKAQKQTAQCCKEPYT